MPKQKRPIRQLKAISRQEKIDRTRNILTTRGKVTKRLLSPELKCVDVTSTQSALKLSTTPVIYCINTINEGSGVNQRIGRRIAMKSLHLKGTVKDWADSGQPTMDFNRMLVIYDRQPNGAAPNFNDVLQARKLDGTTENDAFSPLNFDNNHRFMVIWEKTINTYETRFATSTTKEITQDINDNFKVNDYIPLHGLETHYKGTGNAQFTDIATGSLFFLVVSSTFTAAQSMWQLFCNARLRYTDI